MITPRDTESHTPRVAPRRDNWGLRRLLRFHQQPGAMIENQWLSLRDKAIGRLDELRIACRYNARCGEGLCSHQRMREGRPVAGRKPFDSSWRSCCMQRSLMPFDCAGGAALPFATLTILRTIGPPSSCIMDGICRGGRFPDRTGTNAMGGSAFRGRDGRKVPHCWGSCPIRDDIVMNSAADINKNKTKSQVARVPRLTQHST